MSEGPILVAGAGAAGLAATLAAAKSGAEVVLLERSPHFQQGSNTAMSTAMIPAAGSRWQAEAGIDDAPERFVADIMRKTKQTADARLADTLTRVAPELVAWLADECGLPLELVTDFLYPGHSAARCHTVPERSGKAMLRRLLDAVAAEPDATLLVPMELAAVRRDGDELVAVLRSPAGDEEEIEASAVVLATNGYGGDPELIARHIPEMEHARYHGSDGSRGDALRIGEALGADTAYLDAYQGHGSLAIPHGILLTWAVIVHGGVVVNTEGRRFADESTGYSEFGPLVNAQADRIGWVVYDERIGALCEPFADYQDILEAGAIVRAADVRELAAAIGCAPAVLESELAHMHRVRAGEQTDPFGRTDVGEPPVAPYLAVKVTGALFHTQGGLVVDEHARVLRSGAPIDGLYAAGGAAAGISGHGPGGYLAGNGLLSALGLGYLAGRHAATRAGAGR